MNGQGKSHRPMVPAKPPNKAGSPAAEGVEGRGLAKGNACQQNTPRTQGRAHVPSALEGVRQVARRDKGGKFRVSFVLDTIIRGFYVAIDHGWVGEFVEHIPHGPRSDLTLGPEARTG